MCALVINLLIYFLSMFGKRNKAVDKKIQKDRRIQQLKETKEFAPSLDNGLKRFISFMTHSNSKHITDVFDYYQKCGGKSCIPVENIRNFEDFTNMGARFSKNMLKQSVKTYRRMS